MTTQKNARTTTGKNTLQSHSTSPEFAVLSSPHCFMCSDELVNKLTGYGYIIESEVAEYHTVPVFCDRCYRLLVVSSESVFAGGRTILHEIHDLFIRKNNAVRDRITAGESPNYFDGIKGAS